MNRILLAFIVILSFNLNAQKGNPYESIWDNSEGTELKIPADKFSYFEKGKIYYCILNNSEKIFLYIKVEDSGVQNRILKQGLTVWINMDGKSTKDIGIRFPIGSQYSGSRSRPDMPAARVNPDGSLVTPLSLANTIELIGFKSEERTRFPADNADSFSGSVKYDSDGVLLYRMVMPITKLPLRNSKGQDGTMPFSLGIEYGAPPQMSGQGGTGGQRPATGPPSASGGSRGGSSGGGRPGGGTSGGRPGGGSQGSGSMASQNTTSPVSTWIKNIKLATGR